MAKNGIHHDFNIPKGCREVFLPLADPGCGGLVSAGIFLAGSSELTRGYRIGRPNPNFHLVLFTRNGSARFRSPEKSGTLGRDTVLVVPAGRPCAYEAGKTWDIVWFHLRVQKNWAELSGRMAEIKKTDRAEFINHLCLSLVRECQIGSGLGPVARNTSQLLRSILETEVSPPGNRATLASTANRLVDQVNGHLQFSWTAKNLAEEAALSERHLTRAIRSVYGESPMKMVTRLRLERAKSLLRNTDFRIEDIATMVGYQDPFAFSTAFKRVEGKSPRHFRGN